MAKLKLQAQYLQRGDVLGSGERVWDVIVNSIHWPSNKVHVSIEGKDGKLRGSLWGKYIQINVERADG